MRSSALLEACGARHGALRAATIVCQFVITLIVTSASSATAFTG